VQNAETMLTPITVVAEFAEAGLQIRRETMPSASP
jgi:hypothetical protein